MRPVTHPILRRTAKTVQHLLVVCRNDGLMDKANPKAIAQVSRTGKWLLNAIAQFTNEPKPSAQEDAQ